MEQDKIISKYLESASHYSDLSAREEKFLLMLSVVRLVIFFAGMSLTWLGFTKSITAGFIVLISVLVLFLFILKLFLKHSEKRDLLVNLAKINSDEAKAAAGDFSVFESGESYIDNTHDFSYDIDIFGRNSLFQYLNRTVTGRGSYILSGWLSDPFHLASDLLRRQAAVKEMSGKVEWRHEFMASALDKNLENSKIDGLLEWMSGDKETRISSLKLFLIYFLPAVALVSLALTIAGIVQYSVFIFFFLLNLAYISIGLKQTNAIHNLLSKRYNYLSSIDKLLRVFNNESFDSVIINDIKSNLSGDSVSAAVAIKKLGRQIQMFDSRLNIMISFILNGLLLWDYHCVYRLDRWKNEYCKLFPVWLDMIGEVDALISLANYSYNNSSFVFPSLSENGNLFSVSNMGHMLIAEKSRVCNDFEISHHGLITVVTGANMAGKSTFLRTVAVNYIMAMIGSPVCATEMLFLPSKLFTSMRTTDSLSNNESYFYAELKRLKALKQKIEEGEPVFFILDEILKGTNSADKSLGSKLFIEMLIKSGGTGLIATHDTSLGILETDYPENVINSCFEIEIDGEEIIFDYKIQRGITRKMNAALLMKQMGILDNLNE